MDIYIILTTAGSDTGPFNLYSNVDGYTSAFESGVAKIDLLAGYTTFLAPPGTTIVRVMSDSPSCTNYIDIPVSGVTTTTTSTTTGVPVYYVYEAEIRACDACGFNAGTKIVQSLTPLTLFTYAVETPIPTPIVESYKIIATSILAPEVTVVAAGANCVTACAAIAE
jgi:hypothetical protein